MDDEVQTLESENGGEKDAVVLSQDEQRPGLCKEEGVGREAQLMC